MLKRTLCLFLLFTVMIFTLPACSSPKSAFDRDGRIKICATLFPQYDFARVIGGDRVQVIKLLPSGTESHTFEPTASDIITVGDADLFLYTGEEMEPWAKTMLDGIDDAPTSLDLSSASLTIPPHEHGEGEEHEHTIDPHIWLNPRNAMEMVEAMMDALISLDPEGAATYRSNAEAYLKQLEVLDGDLTAIASQAQGKTLVFGGRFAFAHLCEQYGFSYLSAYHGCDVEAQPSAAQIARVIDFVKENGVGYIFKEEMVAPQSVDTIAKETGASVLLLHSCHNLTQQEMAQGQSYLLLMQANVANIRLALGV